MTADLPRPAGAARVAVRAVRAEWTKFRSVRGSGLALLAMVGLTVGLSVLGTSQAHSDANEGPITFDQFHFVHRTMDGDGAVTARVTSQADSGAWAKAGVMVKADANTGSPYVALMVTPRHGVLLRADAKTELADRHGTTVPRWLKLARSGSTLAGYESADGVSWREVGAVTVADLPAHAEAGLFVGSPPQEVPISVGSRSATIYRATLGEAGFDHVTVDAGPGSAAWRDTDVTPPPPTRAQMDAGPMYAQPLPGGSVTGDDGAVVVKGSGDIGRIGMGGITFGQEDTVADRLLGIHLGLVAAVALGVLAIVSEFSTRTIGATFTARPSRRHVLVAKAVVLSGVVFVVGLCAFLAAFFVTPPLQARNGYGPPVYPVASLTDPGVARAIVGSALFLVLVSLLSLAVGAILRRAASAIILLLTILLVVPTVVAQVSDQATTWIGRVTPVAGLAIQQTLSVPGQTVIGPWAGFAVLCAYTAAALIAACWLLERRDT